ncbi:thioesterase family protein [Jeotgalibacillus sp. R-1-5s-1]|uniref:acyl-CoA thioesterase n=1 Tax=Jeotgalibacillus sp. R-1-5s-1 TaxID=2555897 RepID=UPI0010694E20|nr:thioesterase family protein [Jeotgalibacillus sp. R-1-5s-1]TFD93658.1 acyl-CoA thioesterase [Jeotgalibacillus sp. R-1-5s-1]
MYVNEVTVRFCETDALGHVNNTSYFIYFEEARVQFIASLGYSMNVEDWRFIIASTKCEFKSQGYFDQKLKVESYISRIGTKSFQLEHRVTCAQTRTLIAEGTAVVVYFDFANQRSAAIPDDMRHELEQHLIAEGERV